MILQELLLIKSALYRDNLLNEAHRILDREIRLKELEKTIPFETKTEKDKFRGENK